MGEQPVTQIVADTFSRTDTAGNNAIANAAGWGQASDGNNWASPNVTMTWKITSDEGTATGSAATTQATLGTITQLNANALVRLKASNGPDNLSIGLNIIDANDFYRFKLTATQIIVDNVTGGVVTNLITTAFTRTAGTFYWLRAQVLNGVVYVKAWQDGSQEPGAWTAQAVDASPLGAGKAGLLIGLSTAAHTASFDNFLVVTPPNLATAIGRRGHRGQRGSRGRSY